jgi:uncharacterized protein (DUF1697 family)
MALVVFLRGVNVGRHKRFLPSQIAKDLAAFDVVNIGAAGTFVVRATVSQATLRAEMGTRLGFYADIMIVNGRALVEFARGEPFGRRPPAKDEQRFLSVVVKQPAGRRLGEGGARCVPALPLTYPANDGWQIKVVAVSGVFVASVWRRQQGTPIYPNAVVEKQFGVFSTTRNWNTVETVCKILQP